MRFLPFSPNTRQFADILANTHGFYVVIPDFFRGDALTAEKMANDPTWTKTKEWIAEAGSWEKVSIYLKPRIPGRSQCIVLTLSAPVPNILLDLC